MYHVIHVTFLVRAFALLITSKCSLCLGPILDALPIDVENCDPATMPCANLYFYDANNVLLKIVQDTSSFTIGGVAKLVQKGLGCYTITYEEKSLEPLLTADDLCWDLTLTPSNYKEMEMGNQVRPLAPEMFNKSRQDHAHSGQ